MSVGTESKKENEIMGKREAEEENKRLIMKRLSAALLR